MSHDKLRNLFLQFIIHASTHHFPLQLFHFHRPHYTTWRNNLFDGYGSEYEYGGTGNLQTMTLYFIKEDTRDSYSLICLSTMDPLRFCSTSLTWPSLSSSESTLIPCLCIYHPHHRPLSSTISHFLYRQTLPARDPQYHSRSLQRIFYSSHYRILLFFLLTPVPMSHIPHQNL